MLSFTWLDSKLNILAARRLLTFKPFDVTTEQGRSDERYRLAMLSMGANVLSRGAAMVVMVLTVSLTIPYLGAERFGVWMTIASFAGMLSFLDLGVGNALANRVSQMAAKNDTAALRETISGGLGYLLMIGSCVSILLLLLSYLLPWPNLIKVKDLGVSIETHNAIKIFSILFGFSIISNGIQRVFAGLQQAYFSHLVSLMGSILSLFALWNATKLGADIAYLLMATMGVQLATNLFLLIILGQRRLITLKSFVFNTKSESKHLSHAGGLFFLLQIGTMIGWGADSIIIAGSLGAGHVAIFNVVQRLYQIVSQPLSIMNNPLWGAYADAHMRGDKLFIKNTLKRSMTATVMFSVIVGFVLLMIENKLIQLWTKDIIKIPIEVIVLFYFWTILEVSGNAFSMMLNGCGVVSKQVIAVSIFIMLALPLKMVLIQYGLAYLILGTIISYIIAVPLYFTLFARKVIIDFYK